MRFRTLLAGSLAALCLALPATAFPAEPSLATRLREIVEKQGAGMRLGVVVRDASTGDVLFNHHGDLALNPASNMKLVTAATALFELGADFTMTTGVYGKIEGGGHVPTLVLQGRGDPTLTFGTLVELAEALADRQVRSVSDVIVDGSYFDDRILPPAFEQQPDEVAAFRAPIGAVAIDRGSYVLRVTPGPSEGAPASVRLLGADYFLVDNQITTSGGGAAEVVAIQKADGEKMRLLLRGKVPAGILGVSYRRRIEHPLAHAGHAMADALRRAGIKHTGAIRISRMPESLPLLASHRSPTLGTLLDELGKHSDNFVAEMLLKVVGAEKKQPGTTARGAEVAKDLLARAGVPRDAVSIVNGSGLFDGNKIAADHLARLLVLAYQAPGVRPEFLAHLAVGGVDGTLHRRFGQLNPPRIVRAKTGTLADAIALSGYVLGRDRSFAFSVLANGVRGRASEARKLADDVVTALANELYASP